MTALQPTEVIWYAVAFLLAAGIVAFVTPLTIHVATVFRIHDAPDGRLKKHERPTPYLGGLAVATGFVIAFSLLSTSESIGQRALGILAGGFMMMLLGLYDDLIDLMPLVKFLGQMLAAAALYKAGVRVELAMLGQWGNLVLTVLWITGITNAFNIIDVMDGLAAGVAAAAALVLFLVAVVNGRATYAVLLAALAGALCGFLRSNFEPAKIYMGDAGSLFVGLMLGALAMNNSYTSKNLVASLAPVVILGVPVFDMLFVMYIRYRRGLPVMRGSPDHFALRLRRWRLTTRQTVLLSWGATLLLGFVGIGMMAGTAAFATALLGGLVVLGLGTGLFLKRIDMGL